MTNKIDSLEALQATYDEHGGLHDSPFDAQLTELLDSGELDQDDERRLSLLQWLREQGNGYGPDDVFECTDNHFEVNPHITRDGTSPEEARKRVAFVRDGLQRVVDSLHVGDPDAMRINDQITCQVFVHRDANEDCSEDGARMLSRDVATWTTKDLSDAATLAKRLKNWKFERPSAIAVLSGDRAFIPSYDNLAAAFKEVCPEMLTEGLHDLLNGLYFLCPDSAGSGHSEDHRKTLQEAFNGKPITDRRTKRLTCDSEYMALTDEEADTLWDEQLDSYIDDCLEIPASVENYFDRDKWKRDAKFDGRGQSLSCYDGNEHWNGKWFIYRIN